MANHHKKAQASRSRNVATMNRVAVCFVCGANGPIESRINIKQTNDGGPYFPFLEHHDPPQGARMPSSSAQVEACRICYSFLLGQWESFERSKTPAIKRLYWLKRADDGQFTGVEMRVQGEYAAQVIGLQYNPALYENEPLKDQKVSPRKKEPVTESNDVLDLSVGSHVKKTKEPSSHPERVSERKFVCFLCHTEWNEQKETVVYAASVGGSREPFFPFLVKMNPPKGGKCMSSRGTVQACIDCRTALCLQWDQYEVHKVKQEKRVYTIGTQIFSLPQGYISSDISMTKETCYLCSKLCHKSQVKSLNSVQDSSDEMFFPFIIKLDKPTSARSINKHGRVSSCVSCHAYLQGQWHVYEAKGVPLRERHYTLRPSEHLDTSSSKATDIALQYTPHELLQSMLPSNKTLYGSETMKVLTAAQQLQIAATAVLKEKAQNKIVEQETTHKSTVCYLCGFQCSKLYPTESRLNHKVRPFFPFLSLCGPAPHARDINSEGVVQTCEFCYYDLLRQWIEHADRNIENEDLSRRSYTVGKYQCLICSSNKLTRSMLRSLQLSEFTFLNDLPFPLGTCLLNDGENALVCSTCEDVVNRQYKDFEEKNVPFKKRSYVVKTIKQENIVSIIVLQVTLTLL